MTTRQPSELQRRRSETEFVYDEYGRRTHITQFAGTTDAAETVRTFADSANNETSCMTRVVDPTGAETDYVCNESGDVIETSVVISAIGGLQTGETRTTTTTYDEMGRPTLVEHAGPGVEAFAYDRSGRTTSHDVLLSGTDIASDPFAHTGTTYVDYPTAGNLPTMTETQPDPDRPSGSLTSPVITHTYDWVGNEKSRTDPRTQAVWPTTYDAQNRVVATSTPDPDGVGTGNPALVTTTKYLFGPGSGSGTDASVTLTTAPDGSVTRTTADVLGRTTSTNTGYLNSGSFTTVLDPTNTCYDEVGNVERTEVRSSGTACSGTTTGNAGTVSWSETDHDAWGAVTDERRPWFDGTNTVAVTTASSYFQNTGWLKRVEGPLTDDANHKDQMDYTYDKDGRLKTATMWTKAGATPESFTTTITYNDAGERVRIKSDLTADASRQQVRRFTYTKAGQVETTTEVHGQALPGWATGDVVTTNTYDPAGRLVGVSDPRGFVRRFDYDDLGRETARCQVALVSTACSGSGTTTDEIVTAYNADGSVAWLRRGTSTAGRRYDLVYDTASRMTGIIAKNGSSLDTGNETTYTFNGLGQMASATTPASATAMQYAYYAAGETGGSIGLLKSIKDPFTTSPTAWTYDTAGRATDRTDPAGLTWERRYEDQTGLVNTQKILKSSKVYEWIDLGYDEAANVSSRIQKLWKSGATGTSGAGDVGTGSWTYGYDGAGRMTSAAGPDQAGVSRTWSYGYDGMGNRTSLSVAGTTTLYTTDLQGWPTRSDAGTSGNLTDDVTYSYYADGELSSIDDLTGTANDRTFSYDTWGLTTNASAGSTNLTYTLDPYGRTISRQVNTATAAQYRYAGTSEDLASDGTTSYAYSPAGVLATSGGGTTKFSLTDVHGDVVGAFATGATTSMSEEYWYSPYGEQKTLAGGSSMLGYQGDLSDPATGTVDMGTRLYVPSLGRFSSRDVLFGEPNDAMSMNQFVYGLASPVRHNDPTGMGTGEPQDDDPTKGGEHQYHGYSGGDTSSGSSADSSAGSSAYGASSTDSYSPSSSLWNQPILGTFGSYAEGTHYASFRLTPGTVNEIAQLVEAVLAIFGTGVANGLSPTAPGPLGDAGSPNGFGAATSLVVKTREGMSGSGQPIVSGWTLEAKTQAWSGKGSNGFYGISYELITYNRTTQQFATEYVGGTPTSTGDTANGGGATARLAVSRSSEWTSTGFPTVFPVELRTVLLTYPHFTGGAFSVRGAVNPIYGDRFSFSGPKPI